MSDLYKVSETVLDCTKCLVEKHDQQIRRDAIAKALDEASEHFMNVFDGKMRADWTCADIREQIWYDLQAMKGDVK